MTVIGFVSAAPDSSLITTLLPELSKVVGNVDSTKLKQMLAGLKSKAE